jgi:hypothetical protein
LVNFNRRKRAIAAAEAADHALMNWKKIITISWLCLGTAGLVVSQSFNKSWEIAPDANGTYNLVPYDTSFLILPAGYRNNYLGFYFTPITNQGDSISTLFVEEPGYHLFTGTSNSSNPAAGGGVIMGGGLRDTSDYGWLAHFSPTGKKLWDRKFGDGKHFYTFRQARPNGKGGVVAVGESSQRQIKLNDGWVVVTDSVGNTIFGKVYGDKYEIEHFFNVWPTFDGGYIMGGRRRHWGKLNPAEKWVHNYDPIVYKVDSAGKLEWTYLHDTHYNDIWASVIQTSDSNYVFCSSISDTSILNTPRVRPYLFKLDHQGKLLWKKGYSNLRHNNYLYKIIELPNGNLISCGVTGSYLLVEGLLLLTDANGNPLFEESYQHDTAGYHNDNWLWDVEPMPDGGFMAAGEVVGLPPYVQHRQDPWIIRVDSTGCIKSNCLVGLGQAATIEPSGQIYPNPGNGVFMINAPLGIKKVQAYDLSGKSMILEEIADDQWELIAPSGMYIIQLQTEEGLLRSYKLLKQ